MSLENKIKEITVEKLCDKVNKEKLKKSIQDKKEKVSRETIVTK